VVARVYDCPSLCGVSVDHHSGSGGFAMADDGEETQLQEVKWYSNFSWGMVIFAFWFWAINMALRFGLALLTNLNLLRSPSFGRNFWAAVNPDLDGQTKEAVTIAAVIVALIVGLRVYRYLQDLAIRQTYGVDSTETKRLRMMEPEERRIRFEHLRSKAIGQPPKAKRSRPMRWLTVIGNIVGCWLLVILAGSAFWEPPHSNTSPPGHIFITPQALFATKRYTDSKYGFSFKYKPLTFELKTTLQSAAGGSNARAGAALQANLEQGPFGIGAQNDATNPTCLFYVTVRDYTPSEMSELRHLTRSEMVSRLKGAATATMDDFQARMTRAGIGSYFDFTTLKATPDLFNGTPSLMLTVSAATDTPQGESFHLGVRYGFTRKYGYILVTVDVAGASATDVAALNDLVISFKTTW
jgi:hypothetical protein